jgi:hypothetical protein
MCEWEQLKGANSTLQNILITVKIKKALLMMILVTFQVLTAASMKFKSSGM